MFLKYLFGTKILFKIHDKVIHAIWTLDIYIWFSSSLSFDHVKLKTWNNQRMLREYERKWLGLFIITIFRLFWFFICNEINLSIYKSIYTTIQPSDEELSKVAILSAFFCQQESKSSEYSK